MAREAQSAGLLSDEAMERTIKAELGRRAGEALRESALVMERPALKREPPLSAERFLRLSTMRAPALQ